jgi:HPt (histidine-containing phosphotransfer) domain-containing protein
MFGDDLAAQCEILDIFVRSTHPVLDQLQHVINEGDFAVAGQLAHRLIGSCGNLGAEEFVDLAKAVQRAGETGDRPGLQQLHAEMILAFTRLCGFIFRLKERHESTDH